MLPNNMRLLGFLGMLGSLMLLIEPLIRDPHPSDRPTYLALFELMFLGGWACSVLGLRYERAAGDDAPAHTALGLQLILLLLAGITSVVESMYGNRPGLLYHLDAYVWPIAILYMLYIGYLMMRPQGAWSDWRRYTPLIAGLTFPVSFLISRLAPENYSSLALGVICGLGFFLLGYAVFISGPARNGATAA